METRDIILQKTLGLLLEKGYEGVSVSYIQHTTGMARGLLYHYFGNQDRLFLEAVEKFLNDWLCWDKDVIKAYTVADMIGYVVEKYDYMGQELERIPDSPVSFCDLRLLFLETMRHHSGFADQYRRNCNLRFMVWKTALLNSFSQGELRSGLNLESIARQFVFLQNGIILNTSSIFSISEVIYALDKGLRDFYEIIRR